MLIWKNICPSSLVRYLSRQIASQYILQKLNLNVFVKYIDNNFSFGYNISIEDNIAIGGKHMIDFLLESRQVMIENFQISLRAIRTLMGYSALELAEYIGVTRQTINNLETGKAKMSPTQYISIAAVVDNYILSNGEMFNAIETIIDGNGKKQNQNYDTSFSNLSLLKRWFACFNDSADLNVVILTYKNEEEYGSFLKRLAVRYKIFVDSDVLLESQLGDFSNLISDYLVAENAKLIIPMRAIEQIQEMMQDISISEKAVKALKQVNALQQKNIVQIRGEDSDSNIHDTILTVFAKFRSLHRLCLVTQNKFFAHEVKQLNQNSEKQGFDILVGYIDENGMLALYPEQEPECSENAAEIFSVENFDGITSLNELTKDDYKEVTVDEPSNLTGWGQL